MPTNKQLEAYTRIKMIKSIHSQVNLSGRTGCSETGGPELLAVKIEIHFHSVPLTVLTITNQLIKRGNYIVANYYILQQSA